MGLYTDVWSVQLVGGEINLIKLISPTSIQTKGRAEKGCL